MQSLLAIATATCLLLFLWLSRLTVLSILTSTEEKESTSWIYLYVFAYISLWIAYTILFLLIIGSAYLTVKKGRSNTPLKIVLYDFANWMNIAFGDTTALFIGIGILVWLTMFITLYMVQTIPNGRHVIDNSIHIIKRLHTMLIPAVALLGPIVFGLSKDWLPR
jgi:hypothetical protein